jgi:Sugar-specific transcriptional regulator TrmB
MRATDKNVRTAAPATGGRLIERRSNGVPTERTGSSSDSFDRSGRSRVPGLDVGAETEWHTEESTITIVQGLRLLGLSSREGKMFLALIRGPLGAREASEQAGLHRATGYRVLLRLLDRGLVAGNGRTPQAFHAVSPAVLFRRLELFYRDETEIPGHFAEALVHGADTSTSRPTIVPLPSDRPRLLAAEGKNQHPALLALSAAKRSATAIVRPLATPVGYRLGLARALGQLARRGVSVRLITDATPADYRFSRAIHREAGGSSAALQVRHYCPLAAHIYTIDRERVIRLPTLGASSRVSPVAVLLDDAARVRAQVSRFEGLWAEAYGAVQPLRSTRGGGARIHSEGWEVGRDGVAPGV